MNPQLPIVFLMGPTASGKTAVAVELFGCGNCELISVDSTQVYRRMNIGSAKPSRLELQQTPHALIDIREPWQTYSAADFCDDAKTEISRVHAAGKVPVLVGGTMLYFQSLEKGLSTLPAADESIRAGIENEASSRGWAALHAELAKVDPLAAARIHINDPQRIQRALEVWRLTGKSMSDWHKEPVVGALQGRLLKFALQPADRSELHGTIETRFEQMLRDGLVDEVAALREEPAIHVELPSIRAVGYRQAWRHLDGEIDAKLLLQQGQAATRQLAKRQLTWLRGMDNLRSLDSQSLSAAAMSDIILTAITGTTD